MPDITFKSLDEIPEELRKGAKEVDGAFTINVVANETLKEFRNNNINIAKERDAWKSKFEKVAPLIGDDLEAFAQELPELRKTAQLVADGKLKGDDKIEQTIAQRVAEMQAKFEGEKNGMTTKINGLMSSEAQWKQRYERSVLDQQITNAVIAADGVANPSALPDILARAASLFAVEEDGSVVPKKGGEVIYGSDGVNPMSPKEWLTKLVAEAPYLGKQSAGGGAQGGKGNPQAKFGMSDADFAKLPPQERIRLAREAQKRG